MIVAISRILAKREDMAEPFQRVSVVWVIKAIKRQPGASTL